jgi:4-amino-4-deoxy-L-arabinose transferase-like glycosyltransferase
VIVGCVAWFLVLPLRDVLTFPTRISVFPNLETDAAAYDAFARDFAATGDLAALPSKHPPGWMLMLAAVYAVAGPSYVAGKLVSWHALVVAVGLCAWLAKRMYGAAPAAIAALLCASSPGLRAYVGTLQYEIVTGTLFALLLVMSVRVVDSPGGRPLLRRAVAAGLAGAALVLTRETFVLVVMIVACWMWARLRRADARQALLASALMIATAALPPIVWSVVQSVHYERLILIAEKGPKEFQLGNHSLANGTYNEPLVGMGEPAGWPFVRAHPGRALELAFRKLLYMFGVLRDGWSAPHPPAVWIWRASTGILPLPSLESVVRGGWLLLASVAALVLLGRYGWQRWWAVPASVGAILAVHLITLGSFRFAVPLLPILYVLASGPLDALRRALLPAVRVPLVAASCAVILMLAVLAQFRSWPLDLTFEAADLDGLGAGNAIDDVSGAPVRVGDAQRGVRPIALLPDTYLPRGPVTVSVELQQTTATAGDRAVARVAMLHLDGTPACSQDIGAAQLPAGTRTDVHTRCLLLRDGPATLAIFSLGETDLVIGTIRLSWN